MLPEALTALAAAGGTTDEEQRTRAAAEPRQVLEEAVPASAGGVGLVSGSTFNGPTAGVRRPARPSHAGGTALAIHRSALCWSPSPAPPR